MRPPKRRTWGMGRLLCVVFLANIGVLSWQNIFSLPNAPSPVPIPASLTKLDYPDHFALRLEYLKQYSFKHYVIRPGDTLLQVMEKFHLPQDCLYAWQESCAGICRLDQLQPDDELTIRVGREDGQPVKFTYASVDGATYVFRKVGGKWECRQGSVQPVTILESVKGTITDTLYDSCLRAGLPANLIMDLADLFAYDIDFNTDLRPGDSFAVHFEDSVKGGKRVHSGPILAAEMMVGGERYQAFLYTFSDGYKDYFDAEGNSLRKLFLKAPLSYSRISSTFTKKRLHPVLKIYRPHLGIDYAAPTGTPISALGNGTITFVGKKGGFGRYIEIRHNGTYRTTYGHLSAFAKGLHKGMKVTQGDLIGYVGSSGLATGPHLDFRFYKDGKPIDFLKTDFPHAKSIPKSLQADFTKKLETYLSALHGKTFALNKSATPTIHE